MMVRHDASLLTLWFFKVQNISVSAGTHIDVSLIYLQVLIDSLLTSTIHFSQSLDKFNYALSVNGLSTAVKDGVYGFFVLTVMRHFLSIFFLNKKKTKKKHLYHHSLCNVTLKLHDKTPHS